MGSMDSCWGCGKRKWCEIIKDNEGVKIKMCFKCVNKLKRNRLELDVRGALS